MSRRRPYVDTALPGRKDAAGVEWWACDPYPTWFRWEGGELFTAAHTRWPDEPKRPVLRAAEDCYGSDNHVGGCDGLVTEQPPGGGVACRCRARWFCL